MLKLHLKSHNIQDQEKVSSCTIITIFSSFTIRLTPVSYIVENLHLLSSIQPPLVSSFNISP